MKARSHVVIGGLCWVVAAPALGFPALHPLPLGLAMAASLLPDVDHPKSWVGRRAKPVSTAIAGLLGHRGITHSLVALVAVVALLLHFGFRHVTVSAVAVGYLSHLGADLLTPQGLRLFWPWRRTWSLPLCRTGSAGELLVVAALAIWTAWHQGALARPLALLGAL